MIDYRQKLIGSIEQTLITILSREQTEYITEKILCILNDYDVTERCTDVVIYNDFNNRILKRYSACLLIDGKSDQTLQNYIYELTRFDEFIHKPFTEIGTYDIRYYLACEKERGVSNRTLENKRSDISAFFQWMARDGLIQNNPCSSIKPIKYKDEVRLPFTDVDIDSLRSACRSSKERALVEVLLESGVRVGELELMNVSDINFDNMSVHVKNGKGSKERITYINNLGLLHLKRYLSERSDSTDALFCNRNHERIKAGGIRYILTTIGKRANVNDVHPHRFRRTFATGLAKRGMPVQEIQKLLGHSNIETTLEYVCVDDDKVKASYKQYIA